MPLDNPDLTEFTTASQQLVNFNFTDVIQGTGFIVYNLFNTNEEGTVNYGLTTRTIRPDEKDGQITIATTGGNTPLQKDLDLDFDLVFNIPQTIKGKWFFTGLAAGAHSGIGTHTTFYIIKIRKWDGTTETEIDSAQSQTYSVGTSGVLEEDMAVQGDITSSVHFNKGDTLRVTVETWSDSTNGTGAYGILHNPPDTDISEAWEGIVGTQTLENTKSSVFIPFQLDL